VNQQEWLDANNNYLGASLQWIRAVLKGSAKELQSAAAARDGAQKINPPPTLLVLAQAFELTEFERDVLLLCAAAELDPTVPALCADAQAAGRNFATFGLALQALESGSWESLAAHRPLRYARLVEISQPGATALTAAALRIDERILNFIKGLNVLDERVALLVANTPDTVAEIAPSQQKAVDEIVAAQRPLAYLIGRNPASKLAVAQHACFRMNRRLYRLSAESLPTSKADLETFARLWRRESLLLPVALYVEADELDAASTDQEAALQGLIARDRGPLFVSLREPPRRPVSQALSIAVSKPTPQEQLAAWEESQTSQQAQRLAGQFDMNLDEIDSVVTSAATQAPGVWDRCREMLQPRLDLLAQRLELKATWKDLVLPDESLSLLQQIVGQATQRYNVYQKWGFASRMNRGLGISALFCGESGTGKTLAAEVIAQALELNLYRIDLSAVVSKYIGDTERNLRKLFDAAEQGGAILFFDEADALFGKRSEVKDSHDRYANIEVNYLLQRMESFTGLAILATNMKSALDPAFLRRLRFVVNFQFPGVRERRRIWESSLPQQLPVENVDFERLARFNLAGGNIQSIVLNAAFAAANSGSSLTMPMLLAATRVEMRKLERPINEAEFRAAAVAGKA